jgi:hypothetical protein
MIRAAATRCRRIAWPGLLAALVALGAGLYVQLPPQPRWRLEDCGEFNLGPADRSLFFTWKPGMPDQPAVLRDLRTGEPIRTFFAAVEHQSWMVFAPAGNWIACTELEGGTVHIAAVPEGREHTLAFAANVSVADLQFTADGGILAIGLHYHEDDETCHERLALVETATATILGESVGRLLHVESVLDGARLLVSVVQYGKRSVKVWDVRRRAWTLQLNTATPTGQICPDGRTLVVRDHAAGLGLRRWALRDVEQGTVRYVAPEKSRLYSVSAATQRRRLALAHGRPWDVDVEIWDGDAHIHHLHLEEATHVSIALSPNGRRLAVQAITSSEEISITAVDADTGRRLWERHEPAILPWSEPPPEFGPDGRTIVVYRGWRQPLRVDILDAETGTPLTSLPLAADDVLSEPTITVAPDRRTHTVRLETLHQPWESSWHAWLPAFLRPDPTTIDELLVLDIAAGQVRLRLPLREDEQALLLDDGRLLLTTRPADANRGQSRQICCWDVPERVAWHWVIGIPVALGAAVVGTVALGAAVVGTVALRRRRRTVAS